MCTCQREPANGQNLRRLLKPDYQHTRGVAPRSERRGLKDGGGIPQESRGCRKSMLDPREGVCEQRYNVRDGETVMIEIGGLPPIPVTARPVVIFYVEKCFMDRFRSQSPFGPRQYPNELQSSN